MKKLIILILPILLTYSLYGQEDKHNAVTLNWGMSNIIRQDLTVSPFIHQKWSPVNVLLSYNRTKKLDHLLDVKFSLYNPIIVAPYSFNGFYNGEEKGLAHSFKLIDINYALGKSVIDNDDWRFIVGGKSRNHIYASDYNFGPSGPSPMFISFGLDLWLSVNYTVNEKHYVKSNLSLPVFSYIYRAPYLAQDDEFFENLYSHKSLKEFTSRISDGQIRSWESSQRFDFDVRYGYVLNERWNLGISYLLSMNLNQSPTQFTQIENAFYLNATIKF